MNCIFGIFDILGFKSFCENCPPQDAEKVLKIMDDFETTVPKTVMDALDTQGKVPQEKRDIILRRLSWLTFSDTVFVAIPYDMAEHPDKLKFNLIFFTILVIHINRQMFEIGLPMRGAIHTGDITISKRCYAGRAIVEAYLFANKFQVAGTVVSQQASDLLLGLFTKPHGFHYLFENTIVECDVPTGTKQIPDSILECNTAEKAKTLCWLFFQMGTIAPFDIPSNLKSYITGRFTAHGKTIVGYKEQLKIVNTEKLFNDWRAANHDQGFHEVDLADKSCG